MTAFFCSLVLSCSRSRLAGSLAAFINQRYGQAVLDRPRSSVVVDVVGQSLGRRSPGSCVTYGYTAPTGCGGGRHGDTDAASQPCSRGRTAPGDRTGTQTWMAPSSQCDAVLISVDDANSLDDCDVIVTNSVPCGSLIAANTRRHRRLLQSSKHVTDYGDSCTDR